IILFMPTFRSSTKLNRHDTDSALPILNESNIMELDLLLQSLNQILVIKPHPAQNDISILGNRYNNIMIVKNNDLDRHNINLYELLGQSDALISDFSSVYFDYLLLDKPIGFTIEDIDKYGDNRGFTVDDPLSIMPGPKIKNFDDLKLFLIDLNKSNDQFIDERKRVRALTNEYCEGNARERITDFVGII
ncbi:MAG: CDP-glycerol glycerophosphotransferase family protein, partial [Bacilli bacterium]|nr:CDP-glycerol glycerophosphotransferase family protein [Bacilli bacterium]